MPGSPAVDAGDDAVCPRTDQIGGKRKGPCDIGAIEFRGKKHQKRENFFAQPLELDSAVSRTDGSGSNIVEDLIRAVTAMKSPTLPRDESSRRLESLLDLVGSLLSGVSPDRPLNSHCQTALSRTSANPISDHEVGCAGAKRN